MMKSIVNDLLMIISGISELACMVLNILSIQMVHVYNNNNNVLFLYSATSFGK